MHVQSWKRRNGNILYFATRAYTHLCRVQWCAHRGSVVVVLMGAGSGNRDSSGGDDMVGEAPTRVAYSRTPLGQSIVFRDTHRDRGITRMGPDEFFSFNPYSLSLSLSPPFLLFLCHLIIYTRACVCVCVCVCTYVYLPEWRHSKEKELAIVNTRTLCILYSRDTVHVRVHVRLYETSVQSARTCMIHGTSST